ncbi:MAG TPA: inositol monophosphatase family protein [Egicoccus sp.]|nr:inositol monophosphatase family protein [Egicoccus sp.]HSK23714.1 inositol monophosphatase family protein [Egicoccus sp.]
MSLPDDLALAHDIADIADEITRVAFTGRALPFERKADGSPVTAVDVTVERAVQRTLAQRRPDDGVLGEEIGAVGAAARTWILDGVDGTVNFVAGRPAWATEIALVVDGRPVLGVSTSPALGRRWWGGPDLGAWLGDLPRDPATRPRPLAVAPEGVGFATMPAVARFRGEPEEALLGPLAALGDEVDSPVHGAMLVAGGEAAACLHARGGPWDFAAFAAIVEGAGGRWSDLDGGRRLDHGGPLLYSNGTVHDDLLAAFGRDGPA